VGTLLLLLFTEGQILDWKIISNNAKRKGTAEKDESSVAHEKLATILGLMIVEEKR
jgi:hypothetical protein